MGEQHPAGERPNDHSPYSSEFGSRARAASRPIQTLARCDRPGSVCPGVPRRGATNAVGLVLGKRSVTFRVLCVMDLSQMSMEYARAPANGCRTSVDGESPLPDIPERIGPVRVAYVTPLRVHYRSPSTRPAGRPPGRKRSSLRCGARTAARLSARTATVSAYRVCSHDGTRNAGHRPFPLGDPRGPDGRANTGLPGPAPRLRLRGLPAATPYYSGDACSSRTGLGVRRQPGSRRRSGSAGARPAGVATASRRSGG